MEVLDQLSAWRDEGRGVALATVIATWGSSPRPAGSQLAVEHGGAFEGSVSGGCIEGAVVTSALDAIRTGAHQLLEFGVTNEMAWEVGLACGGQLEVLVERIAPVGGPPDPGSSALDRLATDRQAKRPAALLVELGSGERRLVADSEPPEIADAVTKALKSDRCLVLERAEGRLFVQPFNPPLRLVIVGAVHIAQPLARIGAESGYAVTIIDPRGAFATAARFPDVALRGEWPDEALEALQIDSRTAVVTLTHDPKLDDPALAVALRSSAFYIGALGSRRTQAERLRRLDARGFDAETCARIHGPVGLDIGARSPAEIAVSIMAEMTACLRDS